MKSTFSPDKTQISLLLLINLLPDITEQPGNWNILQFYHEFGHCKDVFGRWDGRKRKIPNVSVF